jgi:hypothetical protein
MARVPAPAKRARASKSAPREGANRAKVAREDTDGVYLVVPGRAKPIPLTLPQAHQAIEELAMRWSYSLRNRERWIVRQDLLEKHRQEIRDVATLVGLEGQALEEVAASDLIEVSIPYHGEAQDWALRIMPWEYLIATATRDLRRGSLTVVRHLRTGRTPGRASPPRGWWHLESAIGSLREDYDFKPERELVRQAAKAGGGKVAQRVRDPNLSALMELLGTVPTHGVLHVSGFDTHQGLQLLDEPDAERVPDGLLVRDGSRVVPAWTVAEGLTRNGRQPRLVAFNVYYSAARTAAACVALGAEAAIGFQDAFDDALAELFYVTFYRAWELSGYNTVAAFRHAWQFVKAQEQPLHGSGVVLWSARSIRETLPAYWGGKGETWESGRIDDRWDEALKQANVQLTDANIGDHVKVEVVPLKELNYSILHNDGSLFEKFTIRKAGPDVGKVPNLHVNVQLHVGTDSYPFRLSLELGEREPQVDLHQRIRVSLATALTRALRESVRTTLYVDVSWGDQALKRETYPITLLPIDEWVDTDANRIWLPSFVQPRDPAVARVIDRAQRYLMAISDDPTMGFSGYQSVDTDLPEDEAPAQRCRYVDAQVRAIWSALLYELPLAYINPPPVFSDYSQRLRLPSDVVDGGRGTCIDLALLLASCLEYVEIYPVIFLLQDHAFPGYWRDETYYQTFVEAFAEAAVTDGNAGMQRAGQRHSWYLERAHFPELVAEVHAGRLVPLETVGLTERIGFESAVEGGTGNLTSRRRFQAMLDIISARWDERNRVTPLPVLRPGEGGGR